MSWALTPAFMRALSTTNIIGNPNCAVLRVAGHVACYRDADMALYWAAAGFMAAEKNFHKILGASELWIFAAGLKRPPSTNIDQDRTVA
ncbi:hypothetical protein [Paraburkholderia sp. A3BS-1L]|uniref:hypothetical protein n=1 Tax=Paraburkholderia sp. A3BS-1L TaxID=3028375 RepID=UPI003DA82023